MQSDPPVAPPMLPWVRGGDVSRAADCNGCMAGNHDLHHRDWGIRPGLIGGTYCDCTGDCVERAKAAFEASPFGGGAP